MPKCVVAWDYYILKKIICRVVDMHVVLKELFLIAVCNRAKAALAVFRKQIQGFEKRRKNVMLNTSMSRQWVM